MAKQKQPRHSGAGKNKPQTNPFSEMEKEVLGFWEKNKIFEKSVKNPPTPISAAALKKSPQPPFTKEGNDNRDYVFYDGPPFATGTPHYGHIVGSVMKDVVPRYWTMNGYKVERRWGWDCHGLPIENIVEKEMNSKSKKDIEKLGVDKFNEACCSKVLGYVEDWRKVITRLGRWADMDNAYKTMDLNYMESIWWVFKELFDKGLIYEGYRSMHVCPRCETTLSQQEVAEGYKDIKDLSAIVKFELLDPLDKGGEGDSDAKTYVLAWTTTPWTLIGNVALAVGEDIDYAIVRTTDLHMKTYDFTENYIIAKERLKEIFKDKKYEIIKKFKGKNLIGKKYKSLFDYYAKSGSTASEAVEPLENKENGWKIYGADFVTTEEGTGVVHIAPAFGEDDMNLGKEKNLPFIQHVNMDGTIKEEVKDFKGKSISPRAKNKLEEIREIDLDVIRFLGDKIFSKEKYTHSYPHCWRCDTALINYATSSWFVSVTKIKDKLLENAKEINWSPRHIKEGRFGKWLEGARDWSISRQRFWASVIPIWKCDGQKNKKTKKQENSCGNIKVIGSVAELKKLSGQEVKDLHKHVVDRITFSCEKCGEKMTRIPDVLDCWFESGSMPYAQAHYHFENKEKFENNFPAKFIAEGVDQTRAWFYYLHVIAGGIKDSRAFDNVIVNGVVLAEDGKKMAKKLQNYPDPMLVFDKYGADALRYYLLTSPVMLAENMNFSEKGVQEALRNVVMILGNVVKFYEMYAPTPNPSPTPNVAGEGSLNSKNVLDKWILARLNQLINEVTDNMNDYNLPKASRPIENFVSDFSTWYIRRSRDRFKEDDEADKKSALETTGYVLLQLSKVMAPFMPFKAESVWQKVTRNNFKDKDKSVHLEEWPTHEGKKDFDIFNEMQKARELTEQILAARDERGFRVRQPIGEAIINFKLQDEYKRIVEEECNIKKIDDGKLDKLPKRGIWRKFGETLAINFELSPELKMEGAKRELVRFINALRKQTGMTIQDRAVIYYETDLKEIKEVFNKMGDDILKDTLSNEIVDSMDDAIERKEVKVNNEEIILGIKKV